jgi:hypothetical protein
MLELVVSTPVALLMRLPDFLIIGAMRAGTTSLFFDLLANPAVFFPQDKEPHCLATDDVLSASGRAAYGDLYRAAGPGQACGDASTGYSKLPDVMGVPERALRVIGGHRARLRGLLLPRAPRPPAPPSLRTVDHILEQVREDVSLLQSLAGWSTRPWDLDAVRDRYAAVGNQEYPKQA